MNYLPVREQGPAASPFAGRTGITYSRVSTQGQNGAAQEERCKSYLLAADVPFEHGFSDRFTGGGDFMQRPAMRELLAYIDGWPQKRFLVVFDDLKRFARDTEFHLKLRHAFRSRDVLLACLNYNFDDSPEGRFAETVFAAQSELERHQNRRQVIQKMSSRLTRGYWTFRHKLGYEIRKDPVHGKLMVPNARGWLLAEALEGFAKGRFVRQMDVLRFLVEGGFWSRRVPDKYVDYIPRLLRDPFYCGDIEYPAWGIERRPGHHQPLISRETFERIQDRLIERPLGTFIRRDINDDFPLRGLLVCDGCRRHLTAAYARGRNKRYPYYYCTNRPCERRSKALPNADIDRRFAALLAEHRLSAEALPMLALSFERSWKAEVADQARQEKHQAQTREKLKAQIVHFSRLACEAQSHAVRRAYEAQLEQVAVELEGLEKAPPGDPKVPYRTALSKVATMLKNPQNTWDSVDTVERHRLFFFLFEARLTYCRKEGFRTAKELSSARLFDRFSSHDSTLVQLTSITSNGLEDGPLPVDADFKKVLAYLERFWAYYETSEPIRRALGEDETSRSPDS